MQFWKKPGMEISRRRTVLLLLPLALLIGLPVPRVTQAQEIIIDHAATELSNDYYLLDAGIRFSFDAEMTEALENGVTIYIDILIRLERMRAWLWDPVVKEETIGFRLERHPLSDNYVITNLQTGIRHQFQHLDLALESLGSIQSHPLINRGVLDPEAEYHGYIQAKLNIEALPAALRPAVYVSRSLESAWYSWAVQ